LLPLGLLLLSLVLFTSLLWGVIGNYFLSLTKDRPNRDPFAMFTHLQKVVQLAIEADNRKQNP
jgi:hypothetical protein